MAEPNTDTKKEEAKYPKTGPNWKPFVGREVAIYINGGAGVPILGVMNQPNLEDGYVDFLPYLSLDADENTAYLETQTPTRVGLSLLERDTNVIRHFKDGYLEQKVREINRRAKRKSPSVAGFAEEAK